MQNHKTDVCSRLFNWLYCLGSVACAVLGPRVVHAHQAPDRALDAVRLEGARPQIDGVLDDPVWQQAPIFTGFVQREPEEGQPASEKTTVQLAYDDEALYVGIMAYDSAPEQIVSRLVRRDQWTEADWIQVSLDTHHDHQTGYAFAVYAGGSIYDAVIKDYGWDNDTWNGVWESAHVIGAEGWSVEFAIPFHNLRFSSGGDWDINIARYISRKKEQAQPRSYSFVAHPGPEESPGFRNRSLHSNAVLRWEYKPGSTLFVVWSQFRHDDSNLGAFRPGYNLRRSFVDEGTNIFLVKLNYWLNI